MRTRSRITAVLGLAACASTISQFPLSSALSLEKSGRSARRVVGGTVAHLDSQIAQKQQELEEIRQKMERAAALPAEIARLQQVRKFKLPYLSFTG